MHAINFRGMLCWEREREKEREIEKEKYFYIVDMNLDAHSIYWKHDAEQI